jgi:hypothetical protein
VNHKSKRPFWITAAALAFLMVTAVIVLYWRPISFTIMNFISEPYDEGFYEKNFEVDNGVIYRIEIDTGERYPVLRYFSDGFENAATIRDLIGLERGWTQITLLSPEAATIPDFNNLANQILKGESNFLDNRIEPSSEQAHAGQQSLKALAVAPDSSMCCTKASLHTLLLHFVKGDNVWFSAWYYIEDVGEFITLMDLETTFVSGWPGMRIRLHKGYLEFEFAKWEPNYVYRQSEGEAIPVPIGRWVFIEAHLLLSDNDDGIIQLWQDGALIIDRRGQTLPFADAVYDSLEIGLSAHSSGPETAILYVDDLIISAEHMPQSD